MLLVEQQYVCAHAQRLQVNDWNEAATSSTCTTVHDLQNCSDQLCRFKESSISNNKLACPLGVSLQILAKIWINAEAAASSVPCLS